ncbi:MAG: hypothetical protein HKO90_04495 [Flavobacteriaceae bacterium]|nr:hypothetical protein [Flavobacteriaceae bacterium]
MLNRSSLLLWLATSFLFLACSEDDSTYVPVEDPIEVSPVVFDIENVPYQNLSEYNFFEGPIAEQNPVYGVLPYDLINPLFSDYAKKNRFIWMPEGVSAAYKGDHELLEFPVGTVMIKNFFYDNVQPAGITQLLETRLMIKKPEGWVFAKYVWNDLQTEAVYDMTGTFIEVEWIEGGETNYVNYKTPAGYECHTCHKIGEIPFPIGPKPHNLNKTFAFPQGEMNQIEKWIDMGYLEDNLPQNINTLVAWDDETADLNERVRSYLDINCAHCHQEEAHCAYRPVRFNYAATDNDTNLGICVEPDNDLGVGLSHIVNPSNYLRSVLYYRLDTTDEAVRMPLMGRTLLHEEGVQLIYDWINAMDSNCE